MHSFFSRWALFITCLFCLSSVGHADSVVVEKNQLKLIRVDQDKSAAILAGEYFGDKQEGWQLTELNGRALFKAGEIVAIPLSPVNPVAVYSKGHRVIPVLCYHQFSPGSKAKRQLEVSAIDFDRQMAYLVDNGYEVIPFSKLSAILAGKSSIPPKAVVLTIDDGYRSVYDIAFPILKKYGLHATLFVYTDFIGGSQALSWQQIKEMKNSAVLDIESHTKTHSSLSYVSNKENLKEHRLRVANEIDSAEQAIRKHLDHQSTLLAYPYGNSSDATIDHLKNSSYALAATVKRGPNSAFADPLLLQRSMIYNDHKLDKFVKMVDGFQAN